MTLLGAIIDEDGSIWIAGDGIEVLTDVASGDVYESAEVDKIIVLDNELAWGYYGESAIGLRFGNQLAALPRDNWGDFLEQSRVTLQRIAEGSTSTGVLLAGFIGGESRLGHLPRFGGAQSLGGVGFTGNGRIAAKAVLRVVDLLLPHMPADERLLLAMGGIVHEARELGFPITLWHLQLGTHPKGSRVAREEWETRSVGGT